MSLYRDTEEMRELIDKVRPQFDSVKVNDTFKEDFSVSDLVERLRTGEIIKCMKCGKGHYVTNLEHMSKSHNFWCNECDDTLHVLSGVTVE